ncbi:FAD-dependent oxidoreductase [Nocardioides fonticola]|uniref:FAD-dependent oxidoreductase n=1 Tax=Nocardioides fonticola TaxID=450363 RepID=A0ABP7XMD0_9ACTN
MSTGERLVIVGGGMAAARLVELLLARDHTGTITVLSDEQYPPYNRILLSAVLDGTHRIESLPLHGAAWYADRGVDLRLGVRVVGLDRERREVQVADGDPVPYDRLVLATGLVPTLPPMRGLLDAEGRLDDRVHAFRDLDDCRRLLDAVPHARRAAVVGGGLLGLQVARGLAARGVEVEIVEGADHLMRHQLDAAAGRILVRDLRRLGTEVYCNARAVRLTDEGVVLDNGYLLEVDLVVITAGGRPSVALARAAGLAVGRGVVVDDRLTTDDPRIHALGDCAEHDGRTPGFVSPAWEQAEVLADVLCGVAAARYEGSRIVARLRARDLEVAVLGDPEHTEGERVEVSNPLTRSHRTLVMREGRIVAAALVGDLSRVGLITQHFDRGTRLAPQEAGLLLLGDPAPAADLAAALGDSAEVCACAGVSAGEIRACASLDDVVRCTRATTGCGGCAPTVRQLLAGRALEGKGVTR